VSDPRRPIGRLLAGAEVEWAAVERALARRRRRRVIGWAMVPAAAAVVAALAAARGRPAAVPTPAGLTLADGRAVPLGVALPSPGELRLSDRSRVTLDPGTSLTVARLGPTAVEITLRAGHASFEVTPGTARRWRIDCGLAAVTVVGTGFDLDLDASRLTVAVRHGAVRVDGPRVEGGTQLVSTGETLAVWSVVVVEPPVPPALTLDAGVDARALPPTVRRRPDAPLRARPDASVADVPVAGPAPSAVAIDPAESLWQRADGARRAQRHADAVALLVALVDEHPGSPRAPMAAFLVGRDRLRVLRQPGPAAEAFARALELPLPESLREEAWLGLVEARWQSGDTDGARAAAGHYRTLYPGGTHRGYIDALVGDAR
jgi:transmembrane sensor